ncbi:TRANSCRIPTION FACTOR WER-LIKE [Salix purpurea]|uniref:TRANSCRIPTION FACTOR WER-LIKE n=1 Tax=Salix purpurea TaxID=77065 RepID=A0A9Q0ZW06_SALPP|nr:TRANSCRIPTION FACTOR WER-LIKE [Salix purpurea]
MKGAAGNGEHRRGLWTVEEDRILTDHLILVKSGKICGLNEVISRFPIPLPVPVIYGSYFLLDQRINTIFCCKWSLIAGRVPGRTDNQVKNHWNTHLSKKLGVKQRKCKINASSSKSSKESGANSRTELKSNDDGSISCRKGEAEIHNVMEDSSEKVRETTSLQDPLLIGDCYDNFWDPYLCAPNLMEFLDQSLDLFWDGM